MSAIVARKRAELRLKLRSLTDDFEHWRARCASDGSELRKHHTQIQRLTTQLGRAHGKLAAEVEARSFDALDAARDMERTVLALFRIWDFFRAKLAQRESARLRPFLAAADDFARACYDPLMQSAAGGPLPPSRRKAQPLTFLNGGTSPFVQTRDDGFEFEDTLGDGAPQGKFGALVRALPVSIVGLPWHEVAHVPELLLIAHEMGHVVEFDFALTEELEQALAKADIQEARRDTWQSWSAEAFADVFGALTGGPAFVGALVDLLAEPTKVVLSDFGDAPSHRGAYPSAMMRVQLAVETIRLVGHQQEADRRIAEWRAQYGSDHELSEFEPDCTSVAGAFIDTTLDALGGHSLKELVAFTGAMQGQASLAATRLTGEKAVTSRNPRELLAAVRLVFEQEPKALIGDGGGESAIVRRVLDLLDEIRDPKVRGEEGIARSAAAVKVDEEAGDAWYGALVGGG